MRIGRAQLVVGVLVAGLAVPAPSVSAAPANYIQPGDAISTNGVGCSAGFVFDGTGSKAGNVYLATAARCVTSVGDDVATTGYGVFGDVAWIGDPDDPTRDVALIEVRADFVGDVSPVVLGAYAPNGYTSCALVLHLGDRVVGAGWEVVAGRSVPRQGVLLRCSSGTHLVAGTTLLADTGGPLLHDETGEALGLVGRLCVGLLCSGAATGPTVERLLHLASVAGFTVTLR